MRVQGLLFVGALLCGISLSAASHYVRTGASGSGADWTDAYGTLPGTLTRGDTYYLATGTYDGYSFTTLNSGTTPITILKATASDHGTSTGWSSSYGTGQAIFTNACTINATGSDYWTFNGQAGNYFTSAPYGIKFLNLAVGGQTFNLRAGGNNTTFLYCEFAGPADGITGEFDFTLETTCLTAWGSGNPVTVSHCYLHGASTIMDGVSNWTVEHSVLSDCKPISGGAHGNMVFMGFGSTNHVFRFNACFNYNDEGYFITGYGGSPHDSQIYGNWFYSPSVVAGHYPRGIEFREQYSYTNFLIYNNSFGPMAGSAIHNATHGTDHTVGCEARNNLAYGCDYIYWGLTDGLVGLGDIVTSHNVVAVSDPFISAAGLNFHLSAATEAGTILGSPYNTDPDGNVRGADSVWDVGAYEFLGIRSARVKTARTGGIRGK